MSELDDLEMIAEANAFGFRHFTCDGIPRQGRRPPAPTCKAGHVRTAFNTKFRKAGKRTRRFCITCDRQRRREKRAAIRRASGPDTTRIPTGD